MTNGRLKMSELQAVLFDLDGTLLDTAPDFATALNRLLVARNKQPLQLTNVRQLVSNGSAGIIEFAFKLPREHTEFEPLRQELLTYYLDTLADQTCLFPGMNEVLTRLAENAIPWGIVTNKPKLYTLEILKRLPLTPPPETVICPDHVSRTKPDPEPILLACSELKAKPENCIYVGDHLRDIQAGLNAGTTTIAALYGYLSHEDQPDSWGAHYQVAHASEINDIIF